MQKNNVSTKNNKIKKINLYNKFLIFLQNNLYPFIEFVAARLLFWFIQQFRIEGITTPMLPESLIEIDKAQNANFTRITAHHIQNLDILHLVDV